MPLKFVVVQSVPLFHFLSQATPVLHWKEYMFDAIEATFVIHMLMLLKLSWSCESSIYWNFFISSSSALLLIAKVKSMENLYFVFKIVTSYTVIYWYASISE